MEQLFRSAARLIAARDFEGLRSLAVHTPQHFNWVSDIFEGIHVRESPGQTALLWTDGDLVQHYSFARMSAMGNQLLNFLRRKGARPADVLFTQMSLQPVNWLAILACIKGGLRMIPAATILSVPDIIYRFGKLLPKVVIADGDNAEKIDEAELRSGLQAEIKIIASGSRPGWFSLPEIEREEGHAEPALTKPDDPLFLFFTSGTTGMPKVVTHTQLSYPLGHLSTASWIGLGKGDIHYNISQPGWAKFAWSSFFAPWNVGATIFAFHHSGRFQARQTLELMEKHRITTFCAPPTVLRMLIQEDLAAYNFHLRECVAAGEPLNPEVIQAWKKGTGILIRDGFGQTESTCLVANLPGTEVRFGSMGKPTFLYEVIIADDQGRELPPGEEGNICVKMDSAKPNGIFREYHGEPLKMQEVFRHGLYFTGDKAYRDPDGYIWFVGRDDDVIKSSDYRVGPFEVESVLLEHEGVLESAVVGSPHPVKGFEIKAFVVLNGQYQPSAQLAVDLFAFCKKNLSPYKMPRLIEFVTELPKTISGKIRRVELRAGEAAAKAAGRKGPHEYAYLK